MLPPQLQQLISHFTRLPGIGPRQAARFVFYLLRNGEEISSLADTLRSVRENISLCNNCYLPAANSTDTDSIESFCRICTNPKRDKSTICVVEKETDALNFEKVGHFQGHYYVLGGFINPLEKENLPHERLALFIQKLQNKRGPTPFRAEIILALSPRREGDFTSLYIEEQIKPLAQQGINIKVTRLGRGLSSGAELEYADEDTLRNALEGRR